MIAQTDVASPHRRLCRARFVMALASVVVGLAAGGCGRTVAIAVSGGQVDAQSLGPRRAAYTILDLRSQAAFEAGHIPGALHIEAPDLNGALAQAPLDRDKEIVLVDQTATRALLHVPTAKLHGFERTVALAGGMQEWTRLGLELERGQGRALLPTTASIKPPEKHVTRLQQLVAFTSGMLIKPTYMLLSLAILLGIKRLKKARDGKDGASARPRSRGLDLLGHGVRWFLVGEVFCAINFYYHPTGIVFPIDLLHGAGMVAMSTLIPWGLFRLLDERLFHFSDPGQRCIVQRFCGRCWKQDGVRCGPHDVMWVVAAGLAIVALMPWSSDLRPTFVLIDVFGSMVDYGQPIVNHLVELRLYPVVGALLLLGALFFLRGGPRSIARAEPIFFIGFGFMAYPMLRHLLVNAFREALFWSDFWEEITELFMILAVGAILLVFRRQLAGQVSTRTDAPANEG
jgi:rhodanese-related sulfurtransferase